MLFSHFLAHAQHASLRTLTSTILCAAALAGCTSLPQTPSPTSMAALSQAVGSAPYLYQDGWLSATAATPPRQELEQAWWLRYEDPSLNQLMDDIERSNPTLEQAQARWRQAQASVRSAQASSAPQVEANLGGSRSGNSGSDSGSIDQLRAGVTIGWALDLWGRNALRVQAAQAHANAAQADIAAARLALQLSTAEHYVQLRNLELQQDLLQATLASYQRALDLTTNQYNSGFVARADVIQAQTQLQSVRTQITSNARQHALAHNALATLSGTVPAALQIAPSPWLQLPAPAAQPSQLPSALLLQRPDLVAAQQLLQAANAELGVAQSAWLPDLDLSLSGALQANSWSQWINAPLRVWSLGPALAAKLFDGGTRAATTAQAQANLDGQTAAWRALVLQAIREVDDALASSAWLQQQHEQQAQLVALAQDNLRVMHNQYDAGMVSYLDVAIVQNQELASRRTMLDLQAQRLLANMQLVAALGGNWSEQP